MSTGLHLPPQQRVNQFIELYDSSAASAAKLLCDRHDPSALAYRLVAADLSARDYSYGQLREESERFAAALHALGIRPGDRVATLMGKSWPYLVTLMGIWRLGAVHVPLFTAFAPPAISMRLISANAKAVVCDPAQQAKLAPGEDMPASPPWQVITTGAASGDALGFHDLLAKAEPGMAAAIQGGDGPLIQIYTSGTTGNPKGVVVPLRALASFRAYAEFGQGLGGDAMFWCAADPGWAYGLYFGVLSTFLTGTPSLLLESGFQPESTLAVLVEHKVTHFAAAPTVYRALRAANLDIPKGRLHLRCASSAGEPLTPEVNAWAEQTLGVTVHDHYGQTEVGMLINNHHDSRVQRPIKTGSMGQALPGWRAVVLQEEADEEAGVNQMGRIALDLAASPLAWFSGYEGNPEKSAEKFAGDGRWLLTGDTGFVDDDGYFHFSARDDDVIIMAGYRIGPFEVESVIAKHPTVVETAVIAVPDEVRGEVMEAYAVLRAGTEPSEALVKELQQWVKTHYAAHAYPRQIHFASALPKTPSGKIQRFVLKQQRLQELAAGQGA